jgi:lipopolysaccharide transport system ATP-binding protein
MSRREIESKLDAIIDFSGLEEFIDTPVKRYSSGMYARLGFSVCAHVDPEVLIVDEVLSVGDYVFQEKCIARMQEVMHSGATVIFVSHNLKAVADLCSRSMLLNHGQVAIIDNTSTVIERYLDMAQSRESGDTDSVVSITDILIDDVPFSGQRFETGQTINLRVSVRANAEIRNFAVLLGLRDEHQYLVFDTSSERLGSSSFNLKQGQVLHCSFQITLNVAYGMYHLGVAVHRYADGRTLESWDPACSMHVGSIRHDYRGIMPAEPKFLGAEIEEKCP